MSSILPTREPWRALLDDERAVTGAAERGVDGREDDVPRGARAVGDVALATVEHPVLAVLAAARPDAGDVAARARLGERVGAPLEQLRSSCRRRSRGSAPSARAYRSRARADRRGPGPGSRGGGPRRPSAISSAATIDVRCWPSSSACGGAPTSAVVAALARRGAHRRGAQVRRAASRGCAGTRAGTPCSRSHVEALRADDAHGEPVDGLFDLLLALVSVKSIIGALRRRCLRRRRSGTPALGSTSPGSMGRAELDGGGKLIERAPAVIAQSWSCFRRASASRRRSRA